MRPLLISLLLFFILLAAADAAVPCDPALITGVPTTEFTFDVPSKTLTCKTGKIIVLDGNRYEALKCDVANGWNVDSKPVFPKKGPIDPLSIKCDAKALACDQVLIKGYDSGQMTYDTTTNKNKLTCKKPYQILKYKDGSDKETASLECPAAGKWKPTTGVTGLVNNAPITVTGCKIDPCHKELITRKDGAFFNAAGVLECPPPKKFRIGSEPTIYDTLKCDSSSNKWDSNPPTTKLPTDTFAVSCVDPPIAACSKALIDGFIDEMKYDEIAHTLTCTKKYQKLKYDGSKVRTITCPATGKWTADGNPTPIERNAKITVTGCEDIPCDEGWIKDLNGATYDTVAIPHALTCSDRMKVKIEPDATLYDKLTCDPLTGTWSNQKKNVEFTVACVQTCTTTAPTDKVEWTANSVKCIDDRKTIMHDTKIYPSLTCDTKWASDEGVDLNKAVTDVLAVTCEDYCTAPGVTLKPSSADPSMLTATCADGEKLYLGGPTVTATEVKDVTCSLKGGWKRGDDPIAGNVEKPLVDLKCIKACENYKTPSPDNKPEASKEDEEGKITVFKCMHTETKNNEVVKETAKMNHEKNVIKLNDKFVFSHPKCDVTNGYTDVTGKILAGAFDEVKLECETTLCSMRGPRNCAAVQNVMPRGYECEDDIDKRSPFHATDDPNLLKCDSMKRLFDEITAKFVTTHALRCSDDKKWHKIDHPEEQQDDERLICFQQTCNKCKKLDRISAATPAEDSTYVAGTEENCATSECKKHLWNVKREGGVFEVYAGEVKCSSEKDTGSKWLDVDNKEILEGSCIPETQHATVKCTVASKLETKCEEAWKGHGCKEITPNDIGDNVCGTQKMFYKEKDFYGFQGEATKINCVEGVWKLTTGSGDVVLTRGGTIICANANPAPTTTTLAPTTTTPFVDPCAVCPKNMTMKCEQCNSKTEAIEYRQSTDTLSCVATPRFEVKYFQTENKHKISGNLTCNKTEKIWRSEETGEVVGQFAAFQDSPEENDNLWIIIGGAVGGVVVLIVIFAVIFKVCIDKKRPDDKDDETKKKMLEESKKKKTKLGDNDDILDEVSVDAPSELKL